MKQAKLKRFVENPESHPAWVCGLKRHSRQHCSGWKQSHPAWVCGLKPSHGKRLLVPPYVTPCVGVWIETILIKPGNGYSEVTPCVGVWIETLILSLSNCLSLVTPCVGVWIETPAPASVPPVPDVTPCVGVWIETLYSSKPRFRTKSHPAWVCGLKLGTLGKHIVPLCHTLRGCVD